MRRALYGDTNPEIGSRATGAEMSAARRLQHCLSSHRIALRVSPRARRMRLIVRPPAGVQFIVPPGATLAQRDAFLSANLAWIVRVRAELERRYRGDPSPVPARIDLPAVGRQWEVVAEPQMMAPLRIRNGTVPALILNASESTPVLQHALQRWLIREARSALEPWLAREALRLGLHPGRALVRLQRTRWGSCSARGTISLNARAMFLAPELVRYLLVHELCHLRHMTHSSPYWALVERFEPDYVRLDACLARSWELIPAWATQA